MGVDVPEIAPQASVEGTQPPTTSKRLLIVGVVGLLAVVVLLVALVPNWGGDEPSKSNPTIDTEFFESSNGPFHVKLPLFSANLIESYESEEEAGADIGQLAKFILNQAITSNADSENVHGGVPQFGGGGGFDEDAAFADEGVQESEPVSGSGTSNSVGDATDFSTNNQEADVDKADLAKSNGDLVFAAYGDLLVIWNAADGEIVNQVRMPPIATDSSGNSGGGSSGSEPEPLPEEPAADTAFARSSAFWGGWHPQIQAILLDGNRLSLIVSGYGYAHQQALSEPPILYDYMATHVRVYDINGGNLALVGEDDFHGHFRNAYSVGANAHVVTKAGINVWDYLINPVQRWQEEFEGMGDDEYIAAAEALAEEELIPTFTQSLLEAIQLGDDVDLAKIGVYANSVVDNSISENWFSGGIANTVSQVISFDMAGTFGDDLSAHKSAMFQPGYWGYVYATDSMIIIADQGWDWDPEEEESMQNTFLLGVRLNGPTSEHAVVGSVKGHLLNPFSIDFVEEPSGEYVRVATTESFWNFGWIEIGVEDTAAVDVATAEDEGSEEEESSTKNLIRILKIPSETSEIPSENVLEQVGSVTLGEPNERFTAIRFFDDLAYAVTFERIDPFYVVDLTDPTNPFAVGELKVSGFSEYLHPINDDNTVLVAVGQEVEDEQIVGLQISLFDSTDPVEPILLDRLVVENKSNQWSSSSVSWDERAFRYLDLGGETGRLIIPVTIYSWVDWSDVEEGEKPPEPENFEGFAVFTIEDKKIDPTYLQIDHAQDQFDADGNFHYYCGSFPQRSFVFNGNVTTMRGSSVISTDLTTGELEWSFGGDDIESCEPV